MENYLILIISHYIIIKMIIKLIKNDLIIKLNYKIIKQDNKKKEFMTFKVNNIELSKKKESNKTWI